MGQDYQRRLHQRQKEAAKGVEFPHIISLKKGERIQSGPQAAKPVGGEKTRVPAKRVRGNWHIKGVGRVRINLTTVKGPDGENLGRFVGTQMYGNVDYEPPKK